MQSDSIWNVERPVLPKQIYQLLVDSGSFLYLSGVYWWDLSVSVPEFCLPDLAIKRCSYSFCWIYYVLSIIYWYKQRCAEKSKCKIHRNRVEHYGRKILLMEWIDEYPRHAMVSQWVTVLWQQRSVHIVLAALCYRLLICPVVLVHFLKAHQKSCMQDLWCASKNALRLWGIIEV